MPQRGPLREPIHMDGGMHMLQLGTASAFSDDDVVSEINTDGSSTCTDGSTSRCRKMPRVLDVAAGIVAAADAAAAKRASSKKQRNPGQDRTISTGADDAAAAEAPVAASAGTDSNSTTRRRRRAAATSQWQPAGLQAQGCALDMCIGRGNMLLQSTAQGTEQAADATCAPSNCDEDEAVDASSGSDSSSDSTNAPGDSASLSSGSPCRSRRRRSKLVQAASPGLLVPVYAKA
jgi:hypothetical protein